MTLTNDQKMIYDLVLENHFANIQILKNQKYLIGNQNVIYEASKKRQLEQTSDILRLITHGKET